MRGPIACLFLAAALWAQQAPIPTEVKTRLAALLPKGGDTARFYSSDLYRYMDGGADIYLKYGLVALAHREYKRAGVDMTVDVFDMAGRCRRSAFTQPSALRNITSLTSGRRVTAANRRSTFCKGDTTCGCRLSATGRRRRSIASRARSREVSAGTLAAGLLDILPRENRVARSEKYVVQAPAGHEFLAPALTASYRFDGNVTSLVISLAADAGEAERRVEQLRQYYSQSGGDAIFFARGRLAVLCLHPPTGAAAFLDRVKP